MQEHASDSLLDSYESERSPHVREYIERAIRLGGIINTKHASQTLASLGRKGDETIKFTSAKPRLGPGLWADDDKLAGRLAPQPALSSGARLDSAVGYEFSLLATPAFTRSLSGRAKAAAREIGLRILDNSAPALQRWLEENGVEAALLRPDRYVLGSAQNEDGFTELLRLMPAAPSIRQSLVATPISSRPGRQ